ncbi:MAG: hypothetical protein RR396_07090, partial [Clostridiales bacterium]
DFQESYAFCQKIGFASLHVFPYSPRRMTVAADLPDQISPEEKDQRSKKLSALAQIMSDKYGQSWENQVLQFLPETIIEEGGRRFWLGHGENYLPLLLPVGKEPLDGFIDVEGKKWQNNRLLVEQAGILSYDGE